MKMCEVCVCGVKCVCGGVVSQHDTLLVMAFDDCGLWYRAGLTLPFAHAIVLPLEAHGLGRFRVVYLDVLAPLISRRVPSDAHAAGTLAGTGGCMEPGKIQRQIVHH